MGTKMITIPFDVERAKRIQAGEELGKVVTRDGKDARVAFWDLRSGDDKHILVVYERDHGYQGYGTRFLDGRINDYMENDKDLMLQVPEWTQYKEGDILVVLPEVVVIFNRFEECTDCCKTKFFVALSVESEKLYFPDREENYFGYREDIKGYANEEQKQQLIVALKASTDPRAKEYLKRFFGIEEKQECEFEPFQKVLVRDDCKSRWRCALFNFYDRRKETSYPFVCIGSSFRYCIPYNDQTKHLLCTTDNWEE
ncbi:hypothetical protein [uncultured Bacteroides sp.]|jgi:hypothetical protein|uniref:hypothetical protein n=1 Tax=uncultured Bacteroides sp. TaxID=162156 RepID=UPI00205FA7B1|nr:hypothetical protein [uncultured Bacteroides sp.]DAL45111.1 MAG TPA_asm: hypothetical protein [Caudoviricetes sp.]